MKTILLAEDDPFIGDVYYNRLKQEGYKVEIARDGKILLEKVKNHSPDLILLDIDLPTINGCDVLKALRSDPKTEKAKVIVLSNYATEDIAEKYQVNIEDFKIEGHFLKVKSNIEDLTSLVKKILT